MNEYILTTKVKAETPEEALRVAYLAGIEDAEAMDVKSCAPVKFTRSLSDRSKWVMTDPRYWMD